jgi:hypothetical protein
MSTAACYFTGVDLVTLNAVQPTSIAALPTMVGIYTDKVDCITPDSTQLDFLDLIL